MFILNTNMDYDTTRSPPIKIKNRRDYEELLKSKTARDLVIYNYPDVLDLDLSTIEYEYLMFTKVDFVNLHDIRNIDCRISEKCKKLSIYGNNISVNFVKSLENLRLCKFIHFVYTSHNFKNFLIHTNMNFTNSCKIHIGCFYVHVTNEYLKLLANYEIVEFVSSSIEGNLELLNACREVRFKSCTIIKNSSAEFLNQIIINKKH